MTELTQLTIAFKVLFGWIATVPLFLSLAVFFLTEDN